MSLYISTLAEMKAELGISDAENDNELTRRMEGLQTRFEEHLQRALARSVNAEELLDGGVYMLLLNRFPVESITSIHVDADQEWTAESLIDSDDYRLDKLRGRVWYGTSGSNPWPAGRQNVRAVYTGGYVAAGTSAGAGQTAMPEAIRTAFWMQLGFEWRNRRGLGAESVASQGTSVSLPRGRFLREVEEALATYRRLG